MIPTPSVWSLRAALAWFVVGFTIGALMLVDKAVGGLGMGTDWLHAHLHVMLFGWLVQIIFAVAFWMLPRFGRDRPRAGLAIAAIVLLNAASVVAMLFPWVRVHEIVLVLEVCAFGLFAIHAWPRIKPFRTET